MQSGAKQASAKAISMISSLQNKLRDKVVSGYDELKGTVLQMMVRRMNEQDRQALVKNWADEDRNPSSDISRSHNQAPVTSGSTRPAATERKAALPVPDLAKALAGATNANLFHPVLGERIADLGYKQLYLTSVQSLAFAPVWKKQRILRPDRAQMIAADKVRSGLAKSLSGTISMFMDHATGEIGIIDGQHRAGALMILSQKGHWSPTERNVLVEVFATETPQQVSALFREINAAEPVRLVDMMAHDHGELGEMAEFVEGQEVGPAGGEQSRQGEQEQKRVGNIPDSSGKGTDQEKPQSAFVPAPAPGAATEAPWEARELADADDSTTSAKAATLDASLDAPSQHEQVLEVLNAATDALAARYPGMFKPSSRCKPPHLNADVLRDELFQSGFLQRHAGATDSAEALLGALDAVNAALAKQHRDAAPGSASAAAAKKAREHGLYLGLDKAWLYAA